jgi:hypothetical protein
MEESMGTQIKRFVKLNNPKARKVKISQDDPFASIFIKPPAVESSPSKQFEDSCSDHSVENNEGHWKNSRYYSLPANVRNAIDVA